MFFLTIFSAGIFTLISALLLMTSADYLLSRFTTDSEVIFNSRQAIFTIFPFYFIYSINQVLIGVIRGYQKTSYPMFAALLSYCIFRVLWCILLLPKYNDLRVVYTSYVASFFVMLGLLVFAYLSYCRCPNNQKSALKIHK